MWAGDKQYSISQHDRIQMSLCDFVCAVIFPSSNLLPIDGMSMTSCYSHAICTKNVLHERCYSVPPVTVKTHHRIFFRSRHVHAVLIPVIKRKFHPNTRHGILPSHYEPLNSQRCFLLWRPTGFQVYL